MIPNTTIPIVNQIETARALLAEHPELLAVYDDATARLDIGRNQALIDRYGATKGSPRRPKWLDSAYWLYEKLLWAEHLGLDRERGLRILDLGTGGGHFCVVARGLGHEPVGLDRDDDYFGEICALLGVQRVVHAILPREPLPDLGRFDLVTGFNVTFNNPSDLDKHWKKEDWRWLLDHLLLARLRPGGRIFLTPNNRYDPVIRTHRPDYELAEVFIEYSGQSRANAHWLDLTANDRALAMASRVADNPLEERP